MAWHLIGRMECVHAGARTNNGIAPNQLQPDHYGVASRANGAWRFVRKAEGASHNSVRLASLENQRCRGGPSHPYRCPTASSHPTFQASDELTGPDRYAVRNFLVSCAVDVAEALETTLGIDHGMVDWRVRKDLAGDVVAASPGFIPHHTKSRRRRPKHADVILRREP
jgi:hypothetical protein